MSRILLSSVQNAKCTESERHGVTHFGPGGRPRGQQIRPGKEVFERFEANPLLRDLTSAAIEHFGTQGDGNHFAYVGTLKSSGETALVTHHVELAVTDLAKSRAFYVDTLGLQVTDETSGAIYLRAMGG